MTGKRPKIFIFSTIVILIFVSYFVYEVINKYSDSPQPKTVTLEKETIYEMTAVDSALSGPLIAGEKVKKLLFYELSTYLEQQAEIKELEYSKDTLAALATVYVQPEILSDVSDGKNYRIQARIVADIDEVADYILSLYKNQMVPSFYLETRTDLINALEGIELLGIQIKSVLKDEIDMKMLRQHNEYVRIINTSRLITEGYIMYLSRNFQRSVEAYSQAIDLMPHNDNIYNARGMSFLASFDFKRAAHDFNKSIDINPKNFDAYNNRGVAYAGLGNYQQAKRDFDEAIKINPDFTYAFVNRGAVFVSNGNRLRTDREHIKDISLYFNIGKPVYFVLDGDFLKVIKIADKLIYSDSEITEISDDYGILYDSNISYKQALRSCDQAINDNPSFRGSYINRGIAFINLGGFEKAVRNLDEAILSYPDNVDLYNYRGRALNVLGKYQQAVQDFAKVVSLDPDFPGIYYQRGIAYYNQGFFEKAADDLRKSIIRNPENEYARLHLLLAAGKTSKENYHTYLDEFQEYIITNHSEKWIRLISKYFLDLDNISESYIWLKIREETNKVIINEKSCEAYYYIGEKKLMEGDRERPQRLFSKSIGTNVYYFFEYSNAKAMIKLLKKEAI